MTRQTERIGRSGEYAVASFLSLESDTVHVLPHGSHADIIFEINDIMYKCQVKTSSKKKMCHKTHKRVNWCFDMRRGANTKLRDYKKGMVDLYAFYCLEYNTIVFKIFKDGKRTKITFKDSLMKNINSKESLQNALDEIKNGFN